VLLENRDDLQVYRVGLEGLDSGLHNGKPLGEPAKLAINLEPVKGF
jgi:hypothetical protein